MWCTKVQAHYFMLKAKTYMKAYRIYNVAHTTRKCSNTQYALEDTRHCTDQGCPQILFQLNRRPWCEQIQIGGAFLRSQGIWSRLDVCARTGVPWDATEKSLEDIVVSYEAQRMKSDHIQYFNTTASLVTARAVNLPVWYSIFLGNNTTGIVFGAEIEEALVTFLEENGSSLHPRLL